MKLLEFIFMDFPHWLGSMMLVYVVLSNIVNFLNGFMNYRVLMKHGYSPCYGDTGPIKEKEEVEKINE